MSEKEDLYFWYYRYSGVKDGVTLFGNGTVSVNGCYFFPISTVLDHQKNKTGADFLVIDFWSQISQSDFDVLKKRS